jgi:hypothetical protein
MHLAWADHLCVVTRIRILLHEHGGEVTTIADIFALLDRVVASGRRCVAVDSFLPRTERRIIRLFKEAVLPYLTFAPATTGSGSPWPSSPRSARASCSRLSLVLNQRRQPTPRLARIIETPRRNTRSTASGRSSASVAVDHSSRPRAQARPASQWLVDDTPAIGLLAHDPG